MALAALAAGLRLSSRSRSFACFAVLLIFLGVVLSSATRFNTAIAWFSFCIYASFLSDISTHPT
jgi:hypothetical protein